MSKERGFRVVSRWVIDVIFDFYRESLRERGLYVGIDIEGIDEILFFSWCWGGGIFGMERKRKWVRGERDDGGRKELVGFVVDIIIR